MTRVFYASTLYGAMSLAAAIDAGLFGDRGERRLLIISDNTRAPEIGDPVDRVRGFEPLRHRFDEIVHWNDVIAPMHPSRFVPRAAEVPMLTLLIGEQLGLDEVSELVLESVAVAPARTIGSLIRECPITVYSDGLMSYGPTRDEIAVDLGRRIGRLLYLDLVPEISPLLLREYDVTPQAIPDSAFLKVVAELPGPVVDGAVGAPVIIGQYLSQLEILTAGEEAALHDAMVRGLVSAGYRHVVFKPHPAAGRSHVRPLQETAARLGVRLTVAADGLPAEAWFAAARPELVVSCFSTALLTARRYYDLPVARTGTELALDRITPYQNSNRIPATIVDAVVPELRPDGRLADPPRLELDQLVQAVGFCMQAARYPELREVASAYLATHGPRRYFKNRRLEAVGLVAPPAYRSAVVRRTAKLAVRAARRARDSASAQRVSAAIARQR